MSDHNTRNVRAYLDEILWTLNTLDSFFKSYLKDDAYHYLSRETKILINIEMLQRVQHTYMVNII